MKKGQIAVTFNWVYILIAGAVILLFFVGIVMKQKASSEQRLSTDVVRIIESIFTGAGVSEKTKNFIDTSGLADYTLFFECDEGVGAYGIKGQAARSESPVEPIFSPAEIRTTQLIVWSLPYVLPFKVIDFLFVTSGNTKYFVLGESTLAEEFALATDGMNVARAPYEEASPGKNFQVRFVDFQGQIQQDFPVPEQFLEFDDTKVTAVSILDGPVRSVTFFQKDGEVWKKQSDPIIVVSLGGERDAALYGAIFSQDEQMYKCNMHKAFSRLEKVLEVYRGDGVETTGKVGELLNYYQNNLELTLSGECLGFLQTYEPNAVSVLQTETSFTRSCLVGYPETFGECTRLITAARGVGAVNEELRTGNCISIY